MQQLDDTSDYLSIVVSEFRYLPVKVCLQFLQPLVDSLRESRELARRDGRGLQCTHVLGLRSLVFQMPPHAEHDHTDSSRGDGSKRPEQRTH